MQNPFEPNIKLEVIDNPFTPSTLGEGGFNSGVDLSKYLKDKEFNTIEKRTKKHNLNSQRLFRQRNREKYNKNMFALWEKNRGPALTDANGRKYYEGNDSYKTWKNNQAIANKNYRLKKLIQNPPSNAINSLLKKEFKLIPKKVGRRKKGEASNAEKMKTYIEDEKNRSKAEEELKKKYQKEYDDFLKEHPDRNLSKTPVYEVGKYEYKQYDPTGLEIGIDAKEVSAPQNKVYNLGELKNYYESVLTDIAPPPLLDQHKKGSRHFAESSQNTNYAGKRKSHAKIFEKKSNNYRVITQPTIERIKVKDTDKIKKIPQGRATKD
jgi:hypothetical protein